MQADIGGMNGWSIVDMIAQFHRYERVDIRDARQPVILSEPLHHERMFTKRFNEAETACYCWKLLP